MRFFAAFGALVVALAQQSQASCRAGPCQFRCVQVAPSACAGGTMNVSALDRSSRLIAIAQDDDGRVRVADVAALTWTACSDNMTFPVSLRECPENKMSDFGVVVMKVSLLAIISLGALASCGPSRWRDWPVDDRHFPGVKWPGVVFIWLIDFWVAVLCSMSGQESFSGTIMEKVISGFLLTFVLWDALLMCLQRCLRGRCVCAVLLGAAYGMFCCLVACRMAYTPSDIAILGHHPLAFGLLNAALSMPKSMVKTRVQERMGLHAARKATGETRRQEWRDRFLDALVNPVKPFYAEPGAAQARAILLDA